ncbi:aldo/keto reductase [Desulfosediminicola flagellatus]|uniref:aldo/keto reductase n=1 Tax=Desulfosediminicola flagellatus TaxID=2569541 RepID=UPI0010AD3AEC|nr:aldo/keto reductase [Desulfosediminicola flagellatus]
MLYRKMPKVSKELSILGFGCMRLPTEQNGTIDSPRAISQIRYAIDQGVNYLDTAWPYHGGKSEPLLGEALKGGYRDKVNIATKLPSWMVKDRADMDVYLNKQLELLKTESIDFYLIHNLNGPMWDNLKAKQVLDFIDKAKASGHIKYAGFSFHGHVADFKKIIDDYDWEFCQIQYNYLDEEHQAGREGLEYAASKDLGIIIMEGLRGGNLGIPEPPPEIGALWNSAEQKRTPVEWALRWIWNHPEVTVVLSGMNQEAHIEENLRIASEATANSLTETDISIVSNVAATYKKLMKVNCTGCEYCKPCPEGVNIPAAFEVFNKLHLFKNVQEAKFMYAIRCSGILSGDEEGYASRCIQCGECLEKCPQQIDIPSVLEEVVTDLEDEKLYERVDKGRKMLNM